jgi:hypothetical protein
MALQEIISGPSALAVYHNFQRLGLEGITGLEHGTPLKFTLRVAERREELVFVHLDALKHLALVGTEFYFEGWLPYVQGPVLVSGFYTTHRRKGHMVTPLEPNRQLGIIRARAEMARIPGKYPQDVAADVRKACREEGLSDEVAEQICLDLGLLLRSIPRP